MHTDPNLDGYKVEYQAVSIADLTELRKDKARLDWVERNANFIEVGHTDVGATRADIDRAMESRNR